MNVSNNTTSKLVTYSLVVVLMSVNLIFSSVHANDETVNTSKPQCPITSVTCQITNDSEKS